MGTGNIEIIIAAEKDNELKKIGTKVIHNERILFDEGVYLFEHA